MFVHIQFIHVEEIDSVSEQVIEVREESNKVKGRQGPIYNAAYEGFFTGHRQYISGIPTQCSVRQAAKQMGMAAVELRKKGYSQVWRDR